jgi:predicted transcriptional regulator
MANKSRSSQPDTQLQEAILSAIQDLLIVALAREGVSKARVRQLVGVGSAKVSRIWKHLRHDKEE